MKKTVVLLLTIVILSACKKDRTCSCTYQDGTVASEATYINVTKKEAKTFCTSNIADVSCIVK